MNRYLKHQAALKSKRISKKKKAKESRDVDLSCMAGSSPGEIFANDSTDESEVHSIADRFIEVKLVIPFLIKPQS